MKYSLVLVILLFSNNLLAQVRFTNITKDAGIDFVHVNGATGNKYLPETMGSGVAIFDFDGDGYEDLFFVNGTHWPGSNKKTSPSSVLYHNQGDGTFEDVTNSVGLDREAYGMGVAIADYDEDGDRDIYLTALGPNLLFRNNGNHSFTEIGADVGVDHNGFGSSATWLDFDNDGDLDLFVLNYVEWSIEKDLFCALDGKNKSYCTPESYQGASAVLYRNEGSGDFKDVTQEVGLENPRGKGLGVAAIDFDQDGWVDLAIANDTQPNYLYHNQKGSFVDVGVLSGIAFGENGAARGAMGIDTSDYDSSGRQSIVIGNFSNEMVSLYHNEEHNFFIDAAPVSELGRNSLLTLAFGTFFFDYDLDGWLDIFVANGHVENDIQQVQQRVSYEQPPHLFRNEGLGIFREVTGKVGSSLSQPLAARGAAFGDIDRDGDLDLVISTSGGPAHLFRNDGGNTNHWISFRLHGTSSNSEAVGARILLTTSERTETRIVKSATGYCSQNQLPVIFGLGKKTEIDRVKIIWPSGVEQELFFSDIDQVHDITEPPIN